MSRLTIDNPEISELPILSENLLYLDIHYAQINELPEILPINLRRLSISNSQINELPKILPINLRILDISNTRIRKLPKILPENLEMLNINNTLISELPDKLPINLKITGLNILEYNRKRLVENKKYYYSLKQLNRNNNKIVKTNTDISNIILSFLYNKNIEQKRLIDKKSLFSSKKNKRSRSKKNKRSRSKKNKRSRSRSKKNKRSRSNI